MLQWSGVLVGCFLFAAEHHDHTTLRIELDDHVGAFVRRPDVVLLIDAHGMRERPGVEVFADFANELAVLIELEKLSRGSRVRRAGRATARKDKHMPLGIDRHAGCLAQIHVLGQFDRVGYRIEADDRHRLLRICACAEQNERRDQPAFLHGSSLKLLTQEKRARFAAP